MMRSEAPIPPDFFLRDHVNIEEAALRVFQFQYRENLVYQSYVDALGVRVAQVEQLEQIPFLPISFFKTHRVVSGNFRPQLEFESSGTTQTVNSRHFVKDAAIYEKSFLQGFVRRYGSPRDYCIIGLLPSYLERGQSSLVYMVHRLMQQSRHPQNGFFLNEYDQLAEVLQRAEQKKQKTLLIGVTFALLDFAEDFPMPLRHVTVMETGGMKGRRRELVRAEVHQKIKTAFDLPEVHSEYGMTEMLSQAYAASGGIFESPPWLRILLRDVNDPLSILHTQAGHTQKGVINVVDLANIFSCSFIATDDLGALHPDGRFEVQGRLDHSALRGCSLLAV